MRLGNKSTRNEQKRQKFTKTLLFKKVLNSNWYETLRIKWFHWESLLLLKRERLRPFIIPDTSSNWKKNDKYRKNLHEKLGTKTMYPKSIEY